MTVEFLNAEFSARPILWVIGRTDKGVSVNFAEAHTPQKVSHVTLKHLLCCISASNSFAAEHRWLNDVIAPEARDLFGKICVMLDIAPP